MHEYYHISSVDRTTSMAHGKPLMIIDTGKYKDAIAARLRKEIDEPGCWMVYAGCDGKYAEQVTSEHKVNVRTAGGRTVQKWIPKTSHAENHLLDCEVYAMCAADRLGARQFRPEQAPTPPPRALPALSSTAPFLQPSTGASLARSKQQLAFRRFLMMMTDPAQYLAEVDQAIEDVLLGGQSVSIAGCSVTRADLKLLRQMWDELKAQIAQSTPSNLFSDVYLARFEGR